MSKSASMLSLLIALFISWALPVWSVIENQLSRSYESALGVAYGMGIGLGIHIISIIVWCIIHRKKINTAPLVILFISLLLMFALTASAATPSLVEIQPSR